VHVSDVKLAAHLLDKQSLLAHSHNETAGACII
jgi:hypothetical protein